MIDKSYIRPGVVIKNDFSIDHLLIHQAELHRAKKTKNPAGGWITGWEKFSDVRCRFTVYNPRDIQTLDEHKELFPTLFKVITFGDEDVQENDRFLFKGVTYEVVSPPIDPSFLGHHLEIQVRAIPKDVVK